VFALKSANKISPYLIITLLLVFCVVLGGYLIRVCERGVPDTAFERVWNGGWVTILNMTTIGYGEIYPVTHFGRFAAIVSCIIGVFLLSLFVVALSNTVELSRNESDGFVAVRKAMMRETIVAR
jgi:potassium intermediate/small conductance calcium-activated channel subfamily N protein 2